MMEDKKETANLGLPNENVINIISSGCSNTASSTLQSQGSASEEYKVLIPSLLSAALVIIGWLVVYKTQANRERRKLIRDFCSALLKEVTELESEFIDYHTTERNFANEHTLISKLTRLEKACSSLPHFLNQQHYFKAVDPRKIELSSTLVQRMRKAMTLEHFLDEHTYAIGFDNEQINEIKCSTEDLLSRIESIRLAALD